MPDIDNAHFGLMTVMIIVNVYCMNFYIIIYLLENVLNTKIIVHIL